MKDDIIYTVIKLVGLAILVVGVAALNRYNNTRHEQNCVSKGGTYYRAYDSAKSLCKLGGE